MVSAGVPSRIGGVESVVDGLSNFLSSAGVSVTVIGRHHKDFVEECGNRKIIGVRQFDLLPKALQFSNYLNYVSGFRAWRKIRRERFDVLHGGCFFPLLFGKETPLIETFHGTGAGIYFRFKMRLKNYQKFLCMFPDKIVARKCDAVVACSQSVKKELVTFYQADPQRIRVIYNGVDVNKFRIQNKTEARKKLGLPSKKKLGIWVGTDRRRKGLDTAIEAVRGLRGVRLLVVGLAGESDGKIIYFGRVNEATKILLYNCADFLIFPTLYEGFPLVPLEAMACGLPIIISKECPTKEIIKKGVHGLVIDDGKPEHYAEKIEAILNDNTHYEEISLNCRQLAEKYSWENQGKEYLKIYEKLILRSHK